MILKKLMLLNFLRQWQLRITKTSSTTTEHEYHYSS